MCDTDIVRAVLVSSISLLQCVGVHSLAEQSILFIVSEVERFLRILSALSLAFLFQSSLSYALHSRLSILGISDFIQDAAKQLQ